MSETKPRLRTRRNAINSEYRTAHRYTKQSKNFLQKNNNGDRFHPSTSEATAAHIHNKNYVKTHPGIVANMDIERSQWER